MDKDREEKAAAKQMNGGLVKEIGRSCERTGRMASKSGRRGIGPFWFGSPFL